MQISGSNFLFGRRATEESYYFSRYPLCWGWASWRRAWRHFDVELTAWKNAEEQNRDAFLLRFDDARERAYWRRALDATAAGEIDGWDYQWAFACIRIRGLAGVPSRNLVSNIGFNTQATHTKGESRLARVPAEEMEFPLTHPVSFERDPVADRLTAKVAYRQASVGGRTLSGIKMLLSASGRRKVVQRLVEEFPGLNSRRPLR